MRDRNENKITLTLIRHGFTEANEQCRYLGITDLLLSDDGMKKIKQKYPTAPQNDGIFVSPMKRCLLTADLIFGRSEKMIIPEFREMDFGDFEGKNYKELSGEPAYQAYIDSNGETAFPNGESKKEFSERTIKGLYKLFDMCRQYGLKNPVAVVHGGTVMAILSHLSKEDYYSFKAKCGEGYRLDIILNDKNEDAILNGYDKF